MDYQALVIIIGVLFAVLGLVMIYFLLRKPKTKD